MFYSKLPKEAVKKFDKAYDLYQNKERTMKIHAKDFNEEINEYFYEANRELYESKNKHIDIIRTKGKYIYDDKFMYLEKKGNIIIFKNYWGYHLTHIIYYNLETQEAYGYWKQQFKRTGVSLMVDFGTKYTMGYHTGWSTLYSNSQRLTDPESINILKEMPQFKYLPIEKFEKINYYFLISATDEMIHNYEILLKLGATKLATGLLLNRQTFSKKDFKKYNNLLKKNRSYDFIMKTKRRDESLIRERQRERESNRLKNFDKKINSYLEILRSTAKTAWEYQDYIIKTPTDLNDIKKEGTKLSHCIYSMRNTYFTRMINKENIVLFMRQKQKQEEPFYTIEIESDKIIQVRTKNNAVNKEITNVVNDWFMDNKNEVLSLYQATN